MAIPVTIPVTTDRGTHPGRRAAAPWLLAYFGVLLVGVGVVSLPALPAIALGVPLYVLAALLPAVAVVRFAMAQTASARGGVTVRALYGGCIATSVALLVEAVLLVLVVGAAYVALQASPEGRGAIDALAKALADAPASGAPEAQAVDLSAFSDLLRQPVVWLAAFALLGFLGPIVEEAAKAGFMAVRVPRLRSRAWVWGLAAGAGFGTVESVALGSVSFAVWPVTMALRGGATLMHATATGLAALAAHALIAQRRPLRASGLFVVAVAVHAAWNSLVLASTVAGAQGTQGTQTVIPVLTLTLLVCLFVGVATTFVYVTDRLGAAERRGAPVSAHHSGDHSGASEHGARRDPRQPDGYTRIPHRTEVIMPALDHARRDRDAALERLSSFLRIPSVSAVPEHAPDVRAAAEWLATRMRDSGIGDVRIDDTPGHPVVFGRAHARREDAPTVLVYGHYDVQPPDPVELWDQPPFEPVERDGALYARGASDDKGQLLCHVDAAAAYAASGEGLPAHVVYVFEGEEEVGSPSLDAWLEAHANELAADVAVVSDTAMVSREQPSIVYGLRGLAYLEVEVTGPNRDLHSGQFGGAVLNPAIALSEMVAALHDEHGRITIPGFYDAVRVLDEAERTSLAAVPFDMDAFQAATGAAGGWGESGFTVPERLGARPSLDVNGMWSGWTGAGAKTVLPAKASAKISMRLVPDQDPRQVSEAFRAHIERLAPDGVSVQVTDLHGGMPALVDRSSPGMRAAAAAYATAFGKEPVFTLEGGTIPVVASFASILGLQTVLMGFGLPDDNLHAPNEKFDVECFHRGTEAVIAFLAALDGQLGAS